MDESGFVVSMEHVPDRVPPPVPSTQRTNKKVKKGSTAAKVPQRKSQSSADLVACLVCNVLVRAERMDKHLKKVHPKFKAGPSRPRPHKLKPKTTSSPSSLPMIVCSICDVHVREDRWERHVAKVHSAVRQVASKPQQNSRNSSGKSIEKVKAEIKDINRKLKQLAPGFHRLKIEELQRRRDTLRKKIGEYRGTAGKASAQTRRKSASSAGTDSELRKEVFRQSRGEEGRYGDKYLGHMRRESDGRFGSLPLYDDYGEESWAD